MDTGVKQTGFDGVSFANHNMHSEEYWEGIVDIERGDWIIDFNQFETDTPSRHTGITCQEELCKRVKGISYIFSCCKQLRLSRSVGLTASTLFHRFYLFESLSKLHYYEVGATAVFVACKAEESRRNLKDVVKVCSKIALGKSDIDEESKVYWKWKDLLVRIEELLLHHLAFNVTPLNPYKITMDALKIGQEPMEKDAPNLEWDAKARTLFGHCTFLFEIMFKLPLCLFYPVEVLCALTTVLSAHKLKISFPVDYLQSSFHIDMNVILKCHDDLIFTASEIETMDKYFRVLPHIPRISHIDIKSVFSGQVESTLRDSLRDDDS